MPLPRSAKPTVEAKTSVRARVSRLAITRLAAGLIAPDFLNASHHNAVTPATCGQAMLVPLRLRKPPPTLAERMSTPGAAICGRVLEKGAIANAAASRPIAPTETTPAAAGNEAATVYGVSAGSPASFPDAATTTAVSRNAACAPHHLHERIEEPQAER